MYEPERPTSPPEPVTADTCICCSSEIYKGERYYKATLGSVCADCLERLPYQDYIAGEP